MHLCKALWSARNGLSPLDQAGRVKIASASAYTILPETYIASRIPRLKRKGLSFHLPNVAAFCVDSHISIGVISLFQKRGNDNTRFV